MRINKINKIGTHPIFSLYILKEDFRIFFSLFKMNRSQILILT
jgi:hypothetical protein